MNHASNDRGFTIPEVLIAVLILTVGILAMIGSSTATQKLISRARRTTLATQVAEGVMDSLRLKANENLQACTGVVANATGYTFQGITVTWGVDARVGVGAVGARVIRVVATYPSMGRTMTDTLTTIFKCDV